VFENGLLKVITAKALCVAGPLGIAALATWHWARRGRRRVALLRAAERASADTGVEGSAWSGTGEPSQASSKPHRTGGTGSQSAASPAPVTGGVVDRRALLSQIIEDNVRLREALR
jgi:hypothetical protein